MIPYRHKFSEYEFDADICYDADNICGKENDIREIWKKLKILEHNLHINNACNKKSACFWDTCEFDNPPVYIPKSYVNNAYQVYGCFCSPECAVAHLMEENIAYSVLEFARKILMGEPILEKTNWSAILYLSSRAKGTVCSSDLNRATFLPVSTAQLKMACVDFGWAATSD